MNALSQTVVVHHPIDREVFHGNDIKSVHDAAALLMGEVAPSPCAALVDASDDTPSFRALRRALLGFGEAALRFGERVFLHAEEARIGDLLPRAEGGEGLQAPVDAHRLPHGRQGRRHGALTREGDVPLARAAAADVGSLGRALDGTMQNDLHLADIHDAQALSVRVQCAADWHLREGEAVVAPLATEAGIAWLLAGFATAEESLEGEVDAHGHVLQHLRLHTGHRPTRGFERGQFALLVIQAYRLLPLFPGSAALGQQVVIQPAAFLKLLRQEALLLLGRIQAVLGRLSPASILSFKGAYCQTRGRSIPPPQPRGFLAHSL